MVPYDPIGFTYLNIIFSYFQPKHMLWVFKRTVSFEHQKQKQMFKVIDEKLLTILH